MNRPQRLAAIVVAAFALAGCAGTQLAPPGMPTVPQVAAQMAMTAAIPPDQVPAFYTSGLTVVQQQCGGYFDAAVMSSLQSAQTAGQAQLLTGLASGIMGLAGVGGPATAGAGLAGSFLTNMLSNQASNSLAGSHPAGVYTLTTTAQSKLIEAIPEPQSAADAWAALFAVYRACSPAGILALREQAIAAAPSRLSVIGGVIPAQAGVQAGPGAMRSMGPARGGRAMPIVRVN